MPFTPLGFDHIVLRVRDRTAAQKFYTESLGCSLERINEEFSLIHLRFGAQQIDLIPGNGATDPDARQGIDHFCLSIQCDDMAALAVELHTKGVDLVGDVTARFGAYGVGPSLYLRDPDGYMIELKPR